MARAPGPRRRRGRHAAPPQAALIALLLTSCDPPASPDAEEAAATTGSGRTASTGTAGAGDETGTEASSARDAGARDSPPATEAPSLEEPRVGPGEGDPSSEPDDGPARESGRARATVDPIAPGPPGELAIERREPGAGRPAGPDDTALVSARLRLRDGTGVAEASAEDPWRIRLDGGETIPGLVRALVGNGAGARLRAEIPGRLAWGQRGLRAPDGTWRVPPGADVIAEVVVLEVQR